MVAYDVVSTSTSPQKQAAIGDVIDVDLEEVDLVLQRAIPPPQRRVRPPPVFQAPASMPCSPSLASTATSNGAAKNPRNNHGFGSVGTARAREVDPDDDGSGVIACEVTGFSNQQLNSLYSISSTILVGGREIYWSQNRKHFMYFLQKRGTWQICPRWEGPSTHGGNHVDLLRDAQLGGSKAIAHQKENMYWEEYVDGVWKLVKLRMRFRTAAQSGYILNSSVPFPPAPPARFSVQGAQLAVTAARSSAVPRTLPPHEQAVVSAAGNELLPPPVPRSSSLMSDSESNKMKVTVVYGSKADCPESNNCAWVGYFPNFVSSDEIADLFRDLSVRSIELTCSSWSEAVVSFNTQSDMEEAVKRDGVFLREHKIVVRRHVLEPLRLPEHELESGSAIEAPPEPERRPVCTFFQTKGYCKFGDKCKLDHSILPLNGVVVDQAGGPGGPQRLTQAPIMAPKIAVSNRIAGSERETTQDVAKSLELAASAEQELARIQAERVRVIQELEEGRTRLLDEFSNGSSHSSSSGSKLHKAKPKKETKDKGKKSRKGGRDKKGRQQSQNRDRKRKDEIPPDILAEIADEDRCHACLFPHSAKVVGARVGILAQPDVGMTTGEYLSTGEIVSLSVRVISNENGRVFLRLADRTGWVSTRSRKDASKIVFVPGNADMPPLEPPGECSLVAEEAQLKKRQLPSGTSSSPARKRNKDEACVQDVPNMVVDQVADHVNDIQAELFKKCVKVVSKSKVGILSEASISSTPTGEYAINGETLEVATRSFTSDGRVFLSLNAGESGREGWISTRSRKDFDKIVLVAADGSDLECRHTG